MLKKRNREAELAKQAESQKGVPGGDAVLMAGLVEQNRALAEARIAKLEEGPQGGLAHRRPGFWRRF